MGVTHVTTQISNLAQDAEPWEGPPAMNALHPQYVVNENQNPTAILIPMPEWEQVVEDLEELDDIRAFDLAKSGSQENDSLRASGAQIDERADE